MLRRLPIALVASARQKTIGQQFSQYQLAHVFIESPEPCAFVNRDAQSWSLFEFLTDALSQFQQRGRLGGRHDYATRLARRPAGRPTRNPAPVATTSAMIDS